MLYCPVNELEPGMCVGATVMHPQRPKMQLIAQGRALEDTLIKRLVDMGVESVWVDYAGTDAVDRMLASELNDAQREVGNSLKQAFTKGSRATISTANIREYGDVVSSFMRTIIANNNYASLLHRLGPTAADPMTRHAASVSYFCLLCGLQLEEYVMNQRNVASAKHAKDLSNLGLAGMLHDIGKMPAKGAGGVPMGLAEKHEAGFDGDLDEEGRQGPYNDHCFIGYQLLGELQAPASTRNAVLFHHMRYDGKGWPDAEGLGPRFSKVPGGDEIHIFPRVLAAANVLDNLLTSAESKGLPPVAALHLFMGDRYDGWFDPIVRSAMARAVPPFAIGSKVQLSDETNCVVLQPSKEFPCRPTVQPLGDGSEAINLAARPELHIARVGKVDVTPYSYDLPKATAAVNQAA